MEVFSINQNEAGRKFQSRSVDLPIRNQPLSSGNRLSDQQSEQITISSLCRRHMIDFLEATQKLIISQQVELLELVTGIETSNKYKILDSLGQTIFLATEQSDCCPRFFLGSLRSFQMRIFDNLGNNVIRIDRHLACQGCPLLMQQMDVFCPTHFLIGYVKEEFSWVYSRFGIFDKDGLKLLNIQGPLFQCALCCKAVYEIKDLTGEVIGSISKQWMGFLPEISTDADTFSLNFPLNLDVNMKVLLLAASFLIDYMYYESSQNRCDKIKNNV